MSRAATKKWLAARLAGIWTFYYLLGFSATSCFSTYSFVRNSPPHTNKFLGEDRDRFLPLFGCVCGCVCVFSLWYDGISRAHPWEIIFWSSETLGGGETTSKMTLIRARDISANLNLHLRTFSSCFHLWSDCTRLFHLRYVARWRQLSCHNPSPWLPLVRCREGRSFWYQDNIQKEETPRLGSIRCSISYRLLNFL